MPSQSPGGYPGITAADAHAKRMALPRGTYQASRWLAVAYELEQLEPWAGNEPRPEVARWWRLLGAAFTAAVDLVKQTRAVEPVSGEDFAAAAARLDGLWPLAKAEGERLGLDDWPSDPRAALAWFTGPSMAAVAERFTQAIAGALVDAGGGRSWGERPSDALPHTDPWHAGYRDRFAAEVEARLLPRTDWWGSMGLIHRDFGVAVNKLNAEYQRWVEVQREVSNPSGVKAEAGVGALRDAITPSALLPHVIDAGDRLAAMDAEWWNREHAKPDPDPDSGIVVIIDPDAEADWHRRREAARLRDALRNQALRVCAALPGLTAPPATTQDAEHDITDGLARWCLEAKAGDNGSAAVPREPAGLVAEGDAAAGAKTGPQSQLEWLAKAMLVVQDHPEWSDRRIAQEVGKSPSTLSRSEQYQQAALWARQASGRSAVKGFMARGKDGTAGVEAIDDSE